MENDEEWDTKSGLRVMAISYVDELDQAAFGCLLSGDGECTDHIRLEHILKRKNAWKESDKAGKLQFYSTNERINIFFLALY
jgi:transcription elongation factor SPT6